MSEQDLKGEEERAVPCGGMRRWNEGGKLGKGEGGYEMTMIDFF